LLVKLHIDMGLEAVLPGPQNALYVMYVMLCWASAQQPGCNMSHSRTHSLSYS